MTMTDTNTATSVEAPAATFAELATVGAVASTDQDRPALTCVHFATRDGALTAEATDSYRLARVTSTVDAPDGFSVLVPAKWLAKALRTVAPARYRGPVTLRTDGATVALESLEGSASTAVGAGQWPNVDRLIPAESTYTAELGAFTGAYLAGLGEVLRGGDPLTVWRCVSMSEMGPSVWTATREGLSALFLIVPVRQ